MRSSFVNHTTTTTSLRRGGIGRRRPHNNGAVTSCLAVGLTAFCVFLSFLLYLPNGSYIAPTELLDVDLEEALGSLGTSSSEEPNTKETLPAIEMVEQKAEEPKEEEPKAEEPKEEEPIAEEPKAEEPKAEEPKAEEPMEEEPKVEEPKEEEPKAEEPKEEEPKADDPDKDCPFRHSPIYRKVYVYPNRGDEHWQGSILSKAGRDLKTLPPWPWLSFDQAARGNETGHYNIYSQNVQYNSELLVRELMMNPKSCLRTMDPEQATLFYVPYLPSMEHHMGTDRQTNYDTSPFGKAILEIIDQENYEMWEQTYGLTADYWKRNKGADHILVFSEPMHGLWHPRSRRGNYHFLHSQKQANPPIVVSVELSTSFVEMYPQCTRKNILVPYPNTDGDWFNGAYRQQAAQLVQDAGWTVASSTAAVPAEVEFFQQQQQQEDEQDAALQSDLDWVQQAPRPLTQFYSAGAHGTCTTLRKAMRADYNQCSTSAKMLGDRKIQQYNHAMYMSTFCPCPGGDSPSAKRMFDAIHAGCIPVILSHDFVWPFTHEFDKSMTDLDPNDFSIRLSANDYDEEFLNQTSCQPLDPERPGLEAYLQSIPAAEIARLRQGLAKARQAYSWYAPDTTDLPQNPLKEGVLPTGGTAQLVVQALADRASGQLWPACEEERKTDHGPDPTQFKC